MCLIWVSLALTRSHNFRVLTHTYIGDNDNFSVFFSSYSKETLSKSEKKEELIPNKSFNHKLLFAFQKILVNFHLFLNGKSLFCNLLAPFFVR